MTASAGGKRKKKKKKKNAVEIPRCSTFFENLPMHVRFSGSRAGDGTGQRTASPCWDPEEPAQGRQASEGAGLPGGRGPQEHGASPGPGWQAAGQDQDLQEANRGGCEFAFPSFPSSYCDRPKSWEYVAMLKHTTHRHRHTDTDTQTHTHTDTHTHVFVP